MEKTEHIFEYINRLKIKIPTKDEFQELSKMFPIDPCSSDSGIVNFERGMLLYGLIAINKPKTLLEIGTAEGYSTLCMAWAMTDYNIPGIIITIDPKSHDAKIERPTLSYNEKDHGVRLSRKELWEKYADKKWIEKIRVITGFSHDVLRNEKQLAIDFAFIDGSHVFEAVKNDFFLVLRSASNKFQILFDDYNSFAKSLWKIFEFLILFTFIFDFVSVFLPSSFYYIIGFIVSIYGIIISFNLKWIAYISFDKKWKSIFYLLVIIISLFLYFRIFLQVNLTAIVIFDLTKSLYFMVISVFIFLYSSISILVNINS